MNIKKYRELNSADQCMVHRYLYYVKSAPIISDYEYDMMEKKALKEVDENHPIHKAGSDIPSHYEKRIRDIATES